MFSAKLNLYKPFSRLITKNRLLTLDVIYKAQPFVDVVSSNQDTYNLDTIYKSQPFIGIPNNYIKRPSLIGINHPDVETWLNTLSLSGGTASSSTISALNTFCNSIDSAGLRRKFYRLNLFCGDNLNSCLVPLYVSSWWNEKVQGFSIDKNFNFSSSDYVETGANGGLLGNGSTKYLDTKLFPSQLPNLSNGGHLSVYAAGSFSSQVAIGVYDYTNPPFVTTHESELLVGATTTNSYINSTTAGISPSYASPVFIIGNRSSNTDITGYANGSAGLSATTLANNANPSFSFFVFARNLIGSPSLHFGQRLRSYSIGGALTSTDITNYNTIMQTFQTALNRNT
jgi:hypothetical protein